MFIQKAVILIRKNRQKAQSFVELAIALPVVLLILLGLVEVVFFIARYLDVMDLTREAARFASLRSAGTESGTEVYTGTFKCSDQSVGNFNFFYHTACLFAPPTNPRDADFKYSANDLVYLNQDTDDVLIQIFSVTNHNTVDKVFPDPEPWALSKHDNYTSVFGETVPNWKKDCKGNVISPAQQPHFTKALVESQLDADPSPKNKGFVAVEFFYCYNQVLNIPIANWFVPNPMRIHAYTFMPNPASQPTITPYVP